MPVFNGNGGDGVVGTSTSQRGVFGQSSLGPGVQGNSTDHNGVTGISNYGLGVQGRSFLATGVRGDSTSSNGVRGQSDESSGVWGQSNRGKGVVGLSNNDSGVQGGSTGGPGVQGGSTRGPGVQGVSTGDAPGVEGKTQAGGRPAVLGDHTASDHNGIGVYGRVASSDANLGVGVYGDAPGRLGQGVFGIGGGIGVSGTGEGTGTGVDADSEDGVALKAATWGLRGTGKAGEFRGPVEVFGDLTVLNGNKPFKIDHPLDPQNKYLSHNAVESPERKNVYDGVVRLGEDGTTSVDLPEWFEALNGDFRYQLTAVGQAAPNLHIVEGISENRFKIAGGEEGLKVCWQVTGTRTDPWAAANPFVVEQEKPQEERGRYLQPDLYNAPEEQSVMRARIGEERLPRMMREEPPSFEPPQAPEMPPGFEPIEPPQPPVMPPGFAAPGFGGLEEENRRQIDELRGQIEELRRVSLEEEVDELRRQVKKLRRRRKR
jgi:hypothetical protein